MADLAGKKGLGGMGKLGGEMKGEGKTKPPAREVTSERMHSEGGDGEGQSTIIHHADGTHTSHMHGGEPMEHPHHLHLMAHIGHHMTGGDAHTAMHHDGMEEHHHSVEEDGTHHDGELGMMDGMGGHAEPDGDEGTMEHPAYGGM